MIRLFFAFTLLISQGVQAQEQIKWLTWNEAVKQREEFFKQNQDEIKSGKLVPKKIFLDVYTNWCGWCKRMDATTFQDPNVVKYMNEHYYPVKLNAEMKDTIVFDGHTFVNSQPSSAKGTHLLAYSLLDGKLSYPTYVILDENMKRSHIIPGYKNALEFLGLLIFFGSNEYLNYKDYLERMLKVQKPVKIE